MRGFGRPFAAVFVALSLAACVHGPMLGDLPGDTAARVELDRTPFYSQQDYYCGPSSLASVLAAATVDIDDWRALADQVYVPDRHGSLQVEMLAAVRRHQRIPYVIPPALSALVAELSAGRPVLVLQNLAPLGPPVWHYAVVIGFDRDREQIILRSGKQRRLVTAARRFERSWARAGNWGFVVLSPGQLPADDDVDRYLQAAAAYQRTGTPGSAAAAYAAATRRWPDSETAWVGLAEAYYGDGEPRKAAAALRVLIERDPASVAAYNNLAFILSELGCAAKARASLEQATRLARQQRRFLEEVDDTRRHVQSHQQNTAVSCP